VLRRATLQRARTQTSLSFSRSSSAKRCCRGGTVLALRLSAAARLFIVTPTRGQRVPRRASWAARATAGRGTGASEPPVCPRAARVARGGPPLARTPTARRSDGHGPAVPGLLARRSPTLAHVAMDDQTEPLRYEWPLGRAWAD